MKTMRYDKMAVRVFDSNAAAGRAAADDLAEILRDTIAERGKAAIIVATGNSQLSFMEAMCMEPGVAWDKVTVFHMDEYLGMSETHSASFRRYIREKLVDPVKAYRFYGIRGDAPDIEAELTRYTQILDESQPVACVLGIGENGHLAFNDPPADFSTTRLIHVVRLAETARRQQVGEGHFRSFAEVPEEALTLTVPALLRPPHVLAVVPEARKAPAVKAALEGPVSPACPASILRTLSHVKLYLDMDAAALLTGPA